MIIGIDLGGTNTGWAALNHNGSRRDSGAWNLSPKPATKTREAEHRAVRWLRMLTNVRALFSIWRPSAVAYERPVGRGDGGGRATFIVHGALLAQMEIAAHEMDYALPLVPLSPDEWKLAACGYGRTKKPAYVIAANERHGLNLDATGDEPKGQDEAAALNIAWAAIKLGKVGAA